MWGGARGGAGGGGVTTEVETHISIPKAVSHDR